MYLSIKDPSEATYQYLINKRENIGLKELNEPKALSIYITCRISIRIFKSTIQAENVLY